MVIPEQVDSNAISIVQSISPNALRSQLAADPWAVIVCDVRDRYDLLNEATVWLPDPDNFPILLELLHINTLALRDDGGAGVGAMEMARLARITYAFLDDSGRSDGPAAQCAHRLHQWLRNHHQVQHDPVDMKSNAPQVTYISGGMQALLASHPHLLRKRPPVDSEQSQSEQAVATLYNRYLNQQNDVLHRREPPTLILGDWLYLGGIRSAHPNLLAELGINTVIGIGAKAHRRHDLVDGGTGAQQQHHHLPLPDLPNADIRACSAQVIDLIQQARAENPDAKILVHCQLGKSRSATAVLAYLMQYHHHEHQPEEPWTLRDAWLHVFHRRPIIQPNAGFVRFLFELESGMFSQTPPSLHPFWLREPARALRQLQIQAQAMSLLNLDPCQQ